MTSDSDEVGGLFTGVNVTLFVLATISVFLRCYVRTSVINSFGPDDYWMLATLASYTANTTVALLSVKYGLGRHSRNLSSGNIKLALKFSYASEITYGLTMILAKISIAGYLLRITPFRIQRRVIYFVTGITCISGLALVLIVAFQCQPTSRVWDHDQPGSCISVEAIRIATYTYSALAIVTDFTFTLLPLFLIWNLQMEWRNKLALVPIFCLALLASIAVVVRIPLVADFANDDFLFATARFGIWSAVEQGLAITAGSLITLRPLTRKLFGRLWSASAQPLSDVRRNSKANGASGSRDMGGGYGYWNGQDRRASDVISLRASNFTRMNADEQEGRETWRQLDTQRLG